MNAMPSETARRRVAVVATPFGFGPASKAVTIGRILSGRYDLDVRYFGTGCALDYFVSQGVPARSLPASTAQLLPEHGAIVNVLAPELIPSSNVAARTHYVDSLGFMWQEADMPPWSVLRHVRGYYAQDLFGGAENLARLGIREVTPVSGVVGKAAVADPPVPGDHPRALVHLGGLVNTAGADSARAYLPLARRLLAELRHGPHELSVAMNRAVGGLGVDVPTQQLTGADFLASIASSDVVFSSPGMTTLVEVSQALKPYVPLPPQNWSQVVITGHMATRSALDVWSFLAQPYLAIDQSADEMRKAATVRQINGTLGSDLRFAAEYGELALAAAKSAEVPALGGPYDGAAQVAAAVAADLAESESA